MTRAPVMALACIDIAPMTTDLNSHRQLAHYNIRMMHQRVESLGKLLHFFLYAQLPFRFCYKRVKKNNAAGAR